MIKLHLLLNEKDMKVVMVGLQTEYHDGGTDKENRNDTNSLQYILNNISS